MSTVVLLRMKDDGNHWSCEVDGLEQGDYAGLDTEVVNVEVTARVEYDFFTKSSFMGLLEGVIDNTTHDLRLLMYMAYFQEVLMAARNSLGGNHD